MNPELLKYISDLSNFLESTYKKTNAFLNNPNIIAEANKMHPAVVTLQKNAPHSNRLIEELKSNPNLSEALKIIPYTQIQRLLYDSEELDNLSILSLINLPNFQNKILYFFDIISIGNQFNIEKD